MDPNEKSPIEEIGGAGPLGSGNRIKRYQDLQKIYDQMKANSVISKKPEGEENIEVLDDGRETVAERGKGLTKDTIGLSPEALAAMESEKGARGNIEKGNIPH